MSEICTVSSGNKASNPNKGYKLGLGSIFISIKSLKTGLSVELMSHGHVPYIRLGSDLKKEGYGHEKNAFYLIVGKKMPDLAPDGVGSLLLVLWLRGIACHS